MKKITKSVFQILVVMGLITMFINLNVCAASWLPDSSGTVNKIYESAKLPVPPVASGNTNESYSDSIIKQVMMSGLAYAKVIIAVFGILYITILGYKMIANSSNEEEITNVKKGITYILIAFMIVSMSQDIGKIFDYSNGTILSSPSEILRRVRVWDKQVAIIISFIKYILAAFAAVMIARSSIKLITSGGNDEQVTKHKHGILYSAAGLLLVYAGDIFINKVFYVVDKNKYTSATGVDISVNTTRGVNEVVGITNMIVSFVGPLAVLMLIVGAIMYLAAGGKEENMQKGKRIIIAVVIGIALIYGTFALVNTFVVGKLSTADATITPITE